MPPGRRPVVIARRFFIDVPKGNSNLSLRARLSARSNLTFKGLLRR